MSTGRPLDFLRVATLDARYRSWVRHQRKRSSVSTHCHPSIVGNVGNSILILVKFRVFQQRTKKYKLAPWNCFCLQLNSIYFIQLLSTQSTKRTFFLNIVIFCCSKNSTVIILIINAVSIQVPSHRIKTSLYMRIRCEISETVHICVQ